MKTITVYAAMAGLLLSSVVLAEGPRGPRDGGASEQGRLEGKDEGRPRPQGVAKRGRRPAFADAWMAADVNKDGVIAFEEFSALRRVRQLPEDKRRRLFDRLDKNGDGKLDREELRKMARGSGAPRPKRLWELDADQSGGVSLEEFRAGHVASKLPPERVEEVFRKLDTNGDGQISPDDRPGRPGERGKGRGKGAGGPRMDDGRKGPRLNGRAKRDDRPDGPRSE